MGAFQDNISLKRIDFSQASNLGIIGACAFAVCGLDYAPTDTPLAFPASLTRINASAFTGNASLCALDLLSASSLVTIGDFAFSSCNLSSTTTYPTLSIPSKVTTIGASAFSYNQHLGRVYFLEATSLTTIGANAFANCNLVSRNEFKDNIWVLTIPPYVRSIGSKAFGGNYIRSTENALNTMEAVVFLGDTPPQVASDAFTSVGYHGDQTAYYNVKFIYARQSKLAAFAALPAQLQSPKGTPSLIGHRTTEVSFANTPQSMRVPAGQSQSFRFSVTFTGGMSDPFWCYDSSAHLRRGVTEAIIIDASIINVATGATMATQRAGIVASNPHVPVTFTFPGDVIAGLPIGSYKVVAHACGTLDGFDNFVDAQAGTLTITGKVQPRVQGRNAASTSIGQTDTFTVTATLSDALFLETGESLAFGCELYDPKYPSGSLDIATLGNVTENGLLTFTFGSAATTAMTLSGYGTYGVRVSSSGSETNLAIAETEVGTVTFSKAQPSLSGALEEYRVCGDDSDFAASIVLADAFFALSPREVLPLSAVLRDGTNTVVASAVASPGSNGTVNLTFDGNVLAQLPFGTYSLSASSPGSQNNAPIDDTNLGSVVVGKAHPRLAGDDIQIFKWGKRRE